MFLGLFLGAYLANTHTMTGELDQQDTVEIIKHESMLYSSVVGIPCLETPYFKYTPPCFGVYFSVLVCEGVAIITSEFHF